MKFKFLIYLIAIFLSGTLSYAQSSYRVNSANGINMRESPSTDADAITTIGKGERVRVIEKTNDKWYKVEYDGETGYVASDYVERDNGSNSNNNNNRDRSGNNDGNRNNSNNGRSNNSSSSRKGSSRKSSKGSGPNYNFGIGLRLGDPTGLTVKKFTDNGAIEFSIGRSDMFYGDDYYYREHRYWYNDWYRDYPYYRDYHYMGYESSFPVGIQLHYLFQKSFKGAKNFQWYLGIGGQFRHQRYTYYYRYRYAGSNVYFYGEETVSDYDIGLDGLFGLEFFIPNTPISIFGDVTLFTEFVDDPVYLWPQGGIGARVNF